MKSFSVSIDFHGISIDTEKDLIDFKILTTKEKNYLFKYHLMVFSKLYKYLDYDEKRWLANFI